MINKFNIICESEYEFVEVQKVLLQKGYCWYYSRDIIKTSPIKITYPLVIKNYSDYNDYNDRYRLLYNCSMRYNSEYYTYNFIKFMRLHKLGKINEN